MLEAFRNHKRWLMFIAMVLIIPSFVVTGIYSYNRMTQADNSIAKVGEISISPESFDRAKREQLERLRAQMGDEFRANMLESEEAREAIVRNLMDEAALVQAVAAEYIEIPEAQAIALIKSADALQQDGKFSPELYQRFLQSQGKSDQQFVAEIRRDLAKETLLSGVYATYPVPKALVQDLHRLLTEERNVRTLVFNASDYLDKVSVTEEEARAYYDAHKSDFISAEHVKAEYVKLSPENFKNVQINPDEVKAFYEQNQSRWGTPEERRASHILVEFGSDKAAALKKAEELLAAAKADPSKFADLARKNSADTGSAAEGGDLSFFGKGLMVKPFEDAVFGAKKGDIVGPVETEFGYHVIYVTDVHDSGVKPFEAVRGEIEAEYVEQKAIEAFSEKAEEFTNIVYEQPDSLEPVAEKFDLKIETVDNVTREGVRDPELQSVFTDHVVDALYGEEALKEKRNTNAIEVRPNVLVAARVVEYQPAAELAFEAVRGTIVERLKLEKASDMAKVEGEKKLAELKTSKSLDGFSAEIWVSRQSRQGQPIELVDAEVALEQNSLPGYVGRAVPGGAYIIAYVKEAKIHDATPDQLRALTSEVQSIYGEADRVGYLDALKTKLKSEILRPDSLKGEKAAQE